MNIISEITTEEHYLKIKKTELSKKIKKSLMGKDTKSECTVCIDCVIQIVIKYFFDDQEKELFIGQTLETAYIVKNMDLKEAQDILENVKKIVLKESE